MISRRQTILIARSSEARLRFGTVTRTIGVSGASTVAVADSRGSVVVLIA